MTNSHRTGHHETQSSSGTVLMAAAAAWETARVNTSNFAVLIDVACIFKVLFISNYIKLSVTSLFLHNVCFSEPSAVIGMNKMRLYCVMSVCIYIYIFFFQFEALVALYS